MADTGKLHSSHSTAIVYKEVIAVIKTIKLSNVIFFILMLLTVVFAVIFSLYGKNIGLSSFSASAKDDTPVLVIDAGHGGEDGGAVSLSGVHESELNLDIALRMAALSGLTGIKYTLTRDSEDILYPDSAKSVSSRKKYDQKRRVEQINNTANAVLVSVHLNCYPHNSPHGAQSFYSKSYCCDWLSELILISM